MAVKVTHYLNVIAKDAGALAEALGGIGKAEWLSENYAFDIPLTDGAGRAGGAGRALAKACDAAAGRAADVNLVAAANRRKTLLIADMDSTIIGCECIDELADMAGLKPKIAAITEKAMRGELDFRAALRERVALLKGLPLEALARVFAERVRLNPGAQALVATMRAAGAYAVLVSGGFTYFTSRVAEEAGFDTHQGNRLIDDGKTLTGEVAEPILGRDAKRDALKRAAAERGLALAETLAVGDGANDRDMIAAAGLGVAYRAKPILTAVAGASIVHGDLAALLYLQGYRETEIRKP